MTSTIDAHIRWMIRRDIPEVLDIEDHSFDFPWPEEDFLHCLRKRNYTAMVAEHAERVVGFIIYELHKNHVHILNCAVSPEHRRRGIGAQMVKRLIDRLSHQRRSRILLEVRETNLVAQKFWSRCGFLATAVLRDFYILSREDAYLMEYRLYRPADFCDRLPVDTGA